MRVQTACAAAQHIVWVELRDGLTQADWDAILADVEARSCPRCLGTWTRPTAPTVDARTAVPEGTAVTERLYVALDLTDESRHLFVAGGRVIEDERAAIASGRRRRANPVALTLCGRRGIVGIARYQPGFTRGPCGVCLTVAGGLAR